jgi:hypothetical protein
MGYYILFDYVHVFYVLLFTRYSCNIANVCVKHQSINQSIHDLLLFTINKKEVYAQYKCATMYSFKNKGNNKITELRTILQRESPNS